MPSLPLAPKCIANKVLSAAILHRRAGKTALSRFGSVLLISALLAQVLLIGPVRSASASGLVPQAPPPVSAPPEPFVVTSAPSGIAELPVLATRFLSTLPALIAKSGQPDGFATIKPPTLFENLVSRASSLFAFVAPRGNT